jgi:DNA-binding transcriptional MocR family regulator
LIATIHNFATAAMPLSRREEVVKVLHVNGVLLLEDDF